MINIRSRLFMYKRILPAERRAPIINTHLMLFLSLACALQCSQIVAGFAKVDGTTVKHEHIDHFMLLLNVSRFSFPASRSTPTQRRHLTLSVLDANNHCNNNTFFSLCSTKQQTKPNQQQQQQQIKENPRRTDGSRSRDCRARQLH